MTQTQHDQHHQAPSQHSQQDRGPRPCHQDRTLGHRVTTGRHTDDCPTRTTPNDTPTNDAATCPGRGNGCAPCPHPHCAHDGWRHLDPTDRAHPVVCPTCVGATRRDLRDIRWHHAHLPDHATNAGHDGRLLAAAPIPGGDALVAYARAGAVLENLRWSKTLDDDHHPDDVVPVLLPLAIWDTAARRHLGHQLPAGGPTVETVITYLADHLTALAQDPDFNWLAMAGDVGALARQLERLLHDEREPERGVPCFECGDPLVRRFGKPTPCRHDTPARRHLVDVHAEARAARRRLDVLATYPELGPPTYADHRAARRTPTGAEETAARRPCVACSTSRLGQGGIEDPTVGQSWECEGCRKHYDAGEYANAVRRHLLTSGPNRDSWTHIEMAAEAATQSTPAGMTVAAGTVRRWMDRTQVRSVCLWQPGAAWGMRLVYWPDVAERTQEYVARLEQRERDRVVAERQAEQLAAAVRGGESVKDAGRRLRIHSSRVRSIEESWAAAEQAS